MSDYRNINQLRTAELTVIRSGFWQPDHILTDGQFEYGKLSRPSFGYKEGGIETATGVYTLKKVTFFGFNLQLLLNGEVIGKLKRNIWDNRTELELNSGLSAWFVRTPGAGIFTRKTSWMSAEGELMTITSRFEYSKPFAVTMINPDKEKENLLLLALIGIHLRLMKNARAAATQ
ncbi:hypothetical protein ACFQZS_03095 [Mucilaginibacter calamicampi]|uniref:Scramblase n=1 Tax=Mucilaginibacter calamicampi TaxID=1302352 RepID=A0ABW2YUZ7_9SPHI